MAKVSQTPDELRAHLEEQLQFLQHSADAFDGGCEGEAKRLAATVRLLCHDTKSSHSLLSLLGMKTTLDYVDTSVPYEPRNKLSHSGLVQIALRNGPSEPRALLDGGPSQSRVAFDDWWDGIVFVDNHKTEFSRRDIVLSLADQDGGAHVDPSLNEEYARLTRDNSLGWRDHSPPEKPLPAANQVPAAMRQIAHELLKTLVPQYEKQPITKPGDFALVLAPTQIEGSALPPMPASNPVKAPATGRVSKSKVGRNKPCPCDSGKKYKKCCGR